MVPRLAFLFLCVVMCFLVSVCDGAENQTKAVCYSGSTLYQRITQDCNEKDPSYTGVWYCAKIEVCESFISSYRSCMITRGCATEQECRYSSSSTGYYDGQEIQVTAGVNPAGMTMTATCCEAHNFPDDDTVALDFSDICNSGRKTASVGLVGLFSSIMALFVYFTLQ